MNMLMNAEKTMSSREIAELTDKQHSHVMRDIREMLDKLDSTDGSKIGFVERINNLGFVVRDEHYELNHELTILLLTGYSVPARMKVIKRWKELEGQQQFQLPTTLSGALMLAAKQAEQLEAQQMLIEQQKPAVDFVEKYVDTSTTFGIREAGKIFGFGQKEFVQTLLDAGVLYRNVRGLLLPYAQYEKKGYFVVKTGLNNNSATAQTRFTTAGIEWVGKQLEV